MNSNRYRTIFSKRLGMLVAVAETAKAQGKGSGAAPGSGARVGRAARSLEADRSLLTRASSHAMSMSRIALAVGSTLGFSAQALAADECGAEAPGADTLSCPGAAYGSISYVNSDGLTLDLNDPSIVIGPTGTTAVSLESSAMNTNDIVINVASIDSANNDTFFGAYVMRALNVGTAGDAAILLGSGTVQLGSFFPFNGTALSSEIGNANSAGAARIEIHGGSITFGGSGSTAALSTTSGLGAAETLMTGGTIIVSGNSAAGLLSRITNSLSTATARTRMEGGSMTFDNDTHALAARNSGLGATTVELTGGTIAGNRGAALFADATNANSTATAAATMSGGSIAMATNASALHVYQGGLGDAVATMTDGSITGGVGVWGMRVEAGNSASIGAARAVMSGGTMDLQGFETYGMMVTHYGAGEMSVAMSGGTIATSGDKSDGIHAEAFSPNATFDLDITGGSVTGGAGAAIRAIAAAGGTIDIGAGATVAGGSSGIAIRIGDADYDGIDETGSKAVITTAGTVSGDVILGAGNDVLNVVGGSIDGNIVGDVGDNVNFALGAGTFSYGAPYAIGGVNNVEVITGTVRLAGTIAANTVDVTGGSLLVNGSVTTTGLVSVANGGTLGGSGTITGPVTVAGGGRIAPGNSPGTLTMGALTLDAASILDFELGEAGVVGGALNDLLVVNGDLVLDGILNVTPSLGGAYGAGVYRLIDYTGTLTNNGLELGLLPAGSINYVQTAIANQVNLINTQGLLLNYWDGPSGHGDGLIGGGSGTWLASPGNENWTLSDGSFNAPYQDGAHAIFAGSAGTVSVDTSLGDINVSGMQFATNGYRIEGDDITLLTGLNPLRVGDGTAAGAGYTATIASELTGDGTLDKTDLGTLVLTGANTYTGGTHVSSGTLQLGSGGTSGSIVGDVVNDSTLAFHRSDASTFSGAISGTGTVRHSGSGTTTLTAAGSNASALQVQAGTLEVASGASFAAQNTNVAANSTLRNNGTFSGTTGADSFALAGTFVGSAALLDGDDHVEIAATANFVQASFDGGAGVDTLELTHGNALTLPETLASNFEHLNKRGAGALTLAGTVNGFSDSIVLAQGTAHLAAATVNTNELRIESGVTLTGTGSLSGGLTNHGVLAPGNSPGTIQIGGNFLQGAGGRLVSEVTRTGVDLLDVAGSATLGGTHQILIDYGLYLDGTTQTLIQAGGGVGGNFATVEINPSALMPANHAVSASAETVSFTRQATTTVTDPGTNRDRYAQWLDDRIAAGGLTPEMIAYVDTLLQQPTAELASSLLGAIAEPAAAISQNSISMLGAGFARAVFDRFGAVDRAQCVSTSASNDALNCAWMRGLRQWGDADGDRFGSAYDWETDGAQFGFDRQLSSWNIGVSFAYGDTDISDALGASNELRSKMGALYGSYQAGRLGIDALALYSAHENRTRREVTIGATTQQARAKFDSDSYGIGARLGYRLTSDAGPLVRPFAELFYDRIDGAQFSERDAGAGNLSVRIQDREGLRGTVGLQLANDYQGYGRVFRPLLELGVAHQFLDNQSALDVQPFAGGDSFRAYSVAMDRTSYLAKASLGISLGTNAVVSIGYSGEIADDHTQHEANLGVRIVW